MLKGIITIIITAFICLIPALAFMQSQMSATVEPNICNQNLDIIKACCSGVK